MTSDRPTGSARDLLGQVIAGCRLERPLGAGAMGEVYLARGLADGRPVVVKFLVSALEDPNLAARFRREGEALRRVGAHAGVVEIYAVVEQPRPCLVMEYVEGVSLLRHLQQHGPPPPLEAARIAREVARGMEAVHAHGLLHRDIKPANVLLTPARQVKLIDFGLVKDTFATALTAPGQVLGTGPYMAPEQWSGDAGAGPAADVYALGATLYHLLTGRPPFQGADFAALQDAVLTGEYPLPRELAPAVPVELERVVVQMLMADPSARYARMRDCRIDLDRVLHGQECPTARLASPSGARLLALVPGRRWVLGSGPACDLRLEAPSVAAQHAQLRRREGGFELRDLRSPAGTYVGEARLTRPATLRDGDRVRLGEATVVFHDPRARPTLDPILQDASRLTLPRLLVEALVQLRDPSAAAWLVEQLRPDPLAGVRVREALAILGPATAPLVSGSAAAAERAALARAEAAPRLLAELAGRPASDHAGWLAWWDGQRLQAPVQASPPLPDQDVRLRVSAGEPVASEVPLARDEGVLLIGRDPKCHVRLSDPAVGRLHCTLLRLHGRWALRDEGRSGGTRLGGVPVAFALVDPGDVVTLGGVRLDVARLEGTAEMSAAGRFVLDPAAFEALASAAHPSAASALVDLLAPDPAALQEAAGRLSELPPPRRAALERAALERAQERARWARAALGRIVGRDLGEDPAAWRATVDAARGRLGLQVEPR